LANLPEELNETYSIIMEEILTQEYPNQEISIAALKWSSCARRQLKAEEFISAVSISPQGQYFTLSKPTLLDICCNLVVYDSVQNFFRFAHLSVREYLEKERHCGVSTANAVALHRCLDVTFGLVNHGLSNAALTHNKAMALKPYAVAYWVQHQRLTSSNTFGSDLRDKLNAFWSRSCRDDPFFTRWILNTHNFRQSLMRRRHIQQLFAKAGLDVHSYDKGLVSANTINGRLLQSLFKQSPESPKKSSILQLAITLGDFPVASWLIESDADANPRAVRLAIKSNSFEITKLLLENGSELDTTVRACGEMDLAAAVATCNLALVELVLKFGATESIYEDDKIDPKALLLGIENENLGIVDLLLNLKCS
jgi:hypothetical protein